MILRPAPDPALSIELALLAARVEASEAALAAARSERDGFRSERDGLRAERDGLRSALTETEAELEKLRNLLKQAQRAQFGRRSEQLDPSQIELALEDREQSAGTAQAAEEQAASSAPDPTSGETKKKKRPPRRNRGALPAHLPRVEETIDVADKTCSCCGGALHEISVEVSEQLDVIPAIFRVKVIRRPKYGCRSCTDGVSQALAPPRPITGGIATEALLAHVLIGKYCDHLPLYRQAQIFARQGIDLDRSTLADWVGRAAWWLTPLHELLVTTVLTSPVVFADDTPVPVLDPGRGRTKTGRLWAYARDERPWNGSLPPAVAYRYSEDRKGVHPANHLADFSGSLQVDGYAGFKRLTGARDAGPIILVFCWAHARRKFYEVHEATQSPVAAEVLRRIAELYKIETEIRGQPPDHRHAIRQAQSKPLVAALKTYLDEQISRISGKCSLAEAIRYTFNHWNGLTRFLEDGHIELDTNTVERAIRPLKLGAKNCLFAGSDGGAETWAVIASLIQTAKLNGVEPFAWLKDVLERIVSGRTKINELEQLLPWNWRDVNRAG